MKATCISACQVEGLGIVTPGETVELDDGYAGDARIRQHFVIDEKTVRNAGAKPPDLSKERAARRVAFAKSLVDETQWIAAMNRLVDDGVELPAEILESGVVPDAERIERLVAKWTENYGYVFPTDPQPKAKTPESSDAAPQDAAPQDAARHGAKKPKKEREDLFGKGE